MLLRDGVQCEEHHQVEDNLQQAQIAHMATLKSRYRVPACNEIKLSIRLRPHCCMAIMLQACRQPSQARASYRIGYVVERSYCDKKPLPSPKLSHILQHKAQQGPEVRLLLHQVASCTAPSTRTGVACLCEGFIVGDRVVESHFAVSDAATLGRQGHRQWRSIT